MSHKAPMDPAPETDLEQWIDRELHRLPECSAPDGMVGRVLEQIQRRQTRPWWQQSLWHWPAWARNLTLLLFVLVSLVILGVGTGLWFPWQIPTFSIQEWVSTRFDVWGETQRFINGFAGLFHSQNASLWLLGAGLFCAYVFLLTVATGSVLLQFTGLRPGFTRAKTR